MQTSEDTEVIVQACKSAGVQLMDGTMWTHSPRTARMEEALRERERMGEVKEVNTLFTFMGESTEREAGKLWRLWLPVVL